MPLLESGMPTRRFASARLCDDRADTTVVFCVARSAHPALHGPTGRLCPRSPGCFPVSYATTASRHPARYWYGTGAALPARPLLMNLDDRITHPGSSSATATPDTPHHSTRSRLRGLLAQATACATRSDVPDGGGDDLDHMNLGDRIRGDVLQCDVAGGGVVTVRLPRGRRSRPPSLPARAAVHLDFRALAECVFGGLAGAIPTGQLTGRVQPTASITQGTPE
jgi:hypothetical protein